VTRRVELHVEAAAVGRAPRGADGRWTDEVAYQTTAELTDVIAHQSLGNGRPARLMVVLEPAVVQRRELLDLPPVPQRELDRLVARGAARFFRQNGHPLITAVAGSGITTQAGRAVRAIAVDSALTDAILAGATRSGAHLTDIHASETGPAISLLPMSERQRRQRQEWKAVLRIAAGTLVLWMATAAVLAGWIGWKTHVVDRELRRLEEPRLALAAARRSMDSATAMVDSIAATDRERDLLAAGLRALVGALPDSALLTRLELDAHGKGALDGRAAAAHLVTERLLEISSLPAVRLIESGNRDSTGGVIWERFRIAMGTDTSP